VLPRHATKQWKRRDPKTIAGVVFHQALAEGATAEAIAKYHVGPNHIDDTGCPGMCYAGFVEADGKFVLANDVEDITWSQGDANIPGDENAAYIAFCFSGDFSGPGYSTKFEPTEAQMKTAGELWSLCKKLFGLSGNQLFGHYDFGKPACPGYTLMNFIETVNQGWHWSDGTYALATIEGRAEALRALGFYGGPRSESWTLSLKAALLAFQKSKGLNPDGVWGKLTEVAVVAALNEKK